MEANKEQALHAIDLAKKALAMSPPNTAKAKRLALKSIDLCDSSEAQNLLERIRVLEEDAKTPNDNTNAHASGAEPFAGSEGIKHRHHTTSTSTTPGTSTPSSSSANAKAKAKDEEKREYTPEQVKMVKRILKCKVTEYYEILSLEKECDENDIKKAYRKMALQLHPDKNGAPGADEAFKMVSKAFQVLSDSNLRAAFDRHGGDPESRFGGGSSAGPAAGRSPFRANGSFEGELSPEDLFNMFFGGGFGGGGFGGSGFGPGNVQFGGSPFGGPVFTASFGPNGFTTNRQRQYRRADPQQNEPRSLKSTLLQLFPIILFLIFTFSSTILEWVAAAFTTPDPTYQFSPSAHHGLGRVTGGQLKVPYWVNQQDFMGHSMMEGARVQDTTSTSTKQPVSPALKRFEAGIEERWQTWKYNDCVRGMERIERKVENMRGFMDIGTNWEGIKKAREEKVEACEELKAKGFRIR